MTVRLCELPIGAEFVLPSGRHAWITGKKFSGDILAELALPHDEAPIGNWARRPEPIEAYFSGTLKVTPVHVKVGLEAVFTPEDSVARVR